MEKLIKDNVSVQPKSGREALQTFTGGEGDVLLSYEYEATTAVKKGEKDIELVTARRKHGRDREPDRADRGRARGGQGVHRLRARRAEGQQMFADWGYRPVDPATLEKNKSKFPDPPKVTTIDDLGGWSKVNDELFDPEKGSIAKIEEDAGVSTAQVSALSQHPQVACATGARPVARRRARARRRHAVAEPDRAAAAGGGGRPLVPGRARRVLEFGVAAARRWPRCASRCVISLRVAAINVVMGTLIAWVLVRDEFRGKRAVNAIIDLPFALPTIVAGITLLALYGDAIAFTKGRCCWRCCS